MPGKLPTAWSMRTGASKRHSFSNRSPSASRFAFRSSVTASGRSHTANQAAGEPLLCPTRRVCARLRRMSDRSTHR